MHCGRVALLAVLLGLGPACGALIGVDALTNVDGPRDGDPGLDADGAIDGFSADGGTTRRFCEQPAQTNALLCDDFDQSGESPGSHWAVLPGSGAIAIESQSTASSPPNDLLVTVPAASTAAPDPEAIQNQFPEPPVGLSLSFDADLNIPGANSTTELASISTPQQTLVFLNVDPGSALVLRDPFAQVSKSAGTVTLLVHPRVTLQVLVKPLTAILSVNGATRLQMPLTGPVDHGVWTVRLGITEYPESPPPPFLAASARYDNVVVTSP